MYFSKRLNKNAFLHIKSLYLKRISSRSFNWTNVNSRMKIFRELLSQLKSPIGPFSVSTLRDNRSLRTVLTIGHARDFLVRYATIVRYTATVPHALIVHQYQSY